MQNPPAALLKPPVDEAIREGWNQRLAMLGLDAKLDRIEAKLGAIDDVLRLLLDGLADEDADAGEPEDLTLEGHPAGRQRDQSQSLG